MSVENNPVGFLPYVAVKLFVAIECGHIYSADANDVTYLDYVRQLTQLISEKLDRGKSGCGITSKCRRF